MFGRVGIIKHTGDTDEILKILRSKEDLFQSADGLISVTYIKISDSEFLGLSQWETKQDMENAASLVQEIMSNFMDKITEPPIQSILSVFTPTQPKSLQSLSMRVLGARS